MEGLKADPSRVMFASLIGPTTPFTVELHTPPGGGTAIPALAHSCSYTTTSSTAVADPPVRVAQLTTKFARNTVQNVCDRRLAATRADRAPRARPRPRSVSHA